MNIAITVCLSQTECEMMVSKAELPKAAVANNMCFEFSGQQYNLCIDLFSKAFIDT